MSAQYLSVLQKDKWIALTTTSSIFNLECSLSGNYPSLPKVGGRVDAAAGKHLHRVARVDEIPRRGGLIVSVRGAEVGVFRVGARLVAWRNVCPHFAAPVCRGTVAGTALPSRVHEYAYGRDGEVLQCPWHGWEFDLLTGRHLAVGSRARLRPYPVEIHGDDVYIAAR
jgi:nitrite reductase (NADH) small subunit